MTEDSTTPTASLPHDTTFQRLERDYRLRGEQGSSCTALARLLAKVRYEPNGCWQWIGSTDACGYGRMYYKGRTASSHRASYELHVGPIPEGLTIDHLCRNRGCVNPTHLEPVTLRVNVLRGETLAAKMAAKTQCPQGHPYDEQNTIRNAKGERRCRICRTAENARQSAKRREQNRLAGKSRNFTIPRVYTD